jgi:hypothetical protein
MHNILIVGLGRLGSRYLEGLASYKGELTIYAVDIRKNAHDSARMMYENALGNRIKHNLIFIDELSKKIPNELDIAIVAVTADQRAKVVELILINSSVRYWLLEKILAQSAAELDSIIRLTSKSAGAWVHVPRRAMRWHQTLKTIVRSKRLLRMHVDGVSWDLATNSIHMIDLAEFLFDIKISSLDTTGLNQFWHESRRDGFYEVNGSLLIQMNDGSKLIFNSESPTAGQSTENLRLMQPKIFCEFMDGESITIDEGAGIAELSTGKKIPGSLEYLSIMCADLVKEILISGTSKLPQLANNINMHQVLLNGLLQHWNGVNGTEEVLPIT